MKYSILLMIPLLLGGGCITAEPQDLSVSEIENIDTTIVYGSEPEEWFTCRTDADCGYLDSSVCPYQNASNWRSVNKDFEEEFLAVNATERSKAVCTEMYIAPPQTPSMCVANRCVTGE